MKNLVPRRIVFFAVSMIWLMLLVGCAGVKKGTVIPTGNIVMVNEHGAMLDPTGNKNCDSKEYPCNGGHSAVQSYRSLSKLELAHYLDELLHSLKNHGGGIEEGEPARILLYLHGGMNVSAKTIQRAVEHTLLVEDESDFYPIYINWRSSLISSYGQHLVNKRQGRNLPWSPRGWAMSPLYLLADVGRAVVRAPIVWVNQVVSDAESMTWTKKSKKIDQHVKNLEARTESASDIQLGGFRKGADDRRNREQVGYFTAYVVTFIPKLASSMFIDAMGTSSWEAMLRRTEAGFHREPPGEFPTAPRKPRTHGDIAVFLSALQQHIDASSRDYEVTLVGHSMGTILLNQIIREYPDLPIKNIVYMAAACSIKDYEDTVYPYLDKHEDTTVYHLTLHRMADVRERMTKLGKLDLPPRGSLLVWIDNYLETPHTERDLTAGRMSNLSQALLSDTPWSDVYPQVFAREFSVGYSHRETDPQKHGDFGSWHYWKDACWDPDPPADVDCYSP